MVDHRESDDGLHHTFRAKTKKTLEQFKKDAALELNGSWASFVVSREWRDRALCLSAPGAHGTASLEGDTIVADITFTSWPATIDWVKARILHDVRTMTESVSEYSSLQAEEFESRARIRHAAADRLDLCRDLESEATRALARWEILDDVTRVLVAVTGTGSAFAAWTQIESPATLRQAGIFVATAVATLGTIQAVLKASDQIKHWSELKGHFVRLKNDLESFINDIDIKSDFAVADFQQRLQGYERRYADGEVLWRTDVLKWVASFPGRVRSLFRRSSSQDRPESLEVRGSASLTATREPATSLGHVVVPAT